MRYSILLVVILSMPVLAFSATIIVPDDHPTIQGAIDAAVNGDTVVVRSGTYVENIDFLGKGITVMSQDGPSVTSIDGTGLPGVLVTFQNGEGPVSVLQGFTVTNGAYGGMRNEYSSPTVKDCVFSSNYGDYGAMFNEHSSPTVNNCVFSSNSGNYGGMLNEYSSPTVKNCVFSSNFGSSGAGISNWWSSPQIVDCQFLNNVAGYAGGGVYNWEGTTLISGCSFVGNQSSSYGGGLANSKYSQALIEKSEFIGNHAGAEGGGMHTWRADPVVTDNLFDSNTSRDGGGLYIFADEFSGYPTITNSVITNNSATDDGGGVYAYGGDPLNGFSNCLVAGNTATRGGGFYIFDFALIQGVTTSNTVVANSATQRGGGMLLGDETQDLHVTNTILWGNSAPLGPQLSLHAGSGWSTHLLISYSDVEGGQNDVHVGPNASLTWGPGMIDSDPLFVDAANDDFHISFLSPCRGSGDNSAVTELYDFEGDLRIYQGTVDMGADEFYTHLYCMGDFTPGGAIEGKFIGLPGTTPVGLFIGSGVLPSPIPTTWGDYWLQAPWVLLGPLGAIPSDGVMVLPTTLPPGMTAPVDIPMQALIGLNADSLSNLCVLKVR